MNEARKNPGSGGDENTSLGNGAYKKDINNILKGP